MTALAPDPPYNADPAASYWRGLTATADYRWGKSENNTDGAFSVPASDSPASERGSSNFDVRHRISASLNSSAKKGASLVVFLSGASGTPYTIRTGRDDNGDLVFNDRPAGVGRNTERAEWTWTSWAMLSYGFGFGKKRLPGGTGITGISFGPGGASVTQGTYAAQPRYRLSFTQNVQNITNRPNYTGYSGVMTSPFFKKPTMVQGLRTMDLSMGLSF